MSENEVKEKAPTLEEIGVFVGCKIHPDVCARLDAESVLHDRKRAYMLRELIDEALTAREKARQQPPPPPGRPGRI